MRKNNIDLLIEEIDTKGYEIVEDFIARREAERFFLEFKTTEFADYASKRSLPSSDRKNLAKAISGFGNSEGGLLVWGIDARVDTSGGDYAKAVRPIQSVDSFRALLESFVSVVTIPAHRTIDNLILKKSPTDDEGVVVTVIPRSGDRPLQNINEGNFRYYMRAGDSFIPISDTLLRDMFGKEPTPEVAFMYNVAEPKKVGDGLSVDIGVMAVNGGLGIAQDIYGHIRIWPPGPKTQIGLKPHDNTNYIFQWSYGVEGSFISKPDFRLGYQQRSQIVVLHFHLEPPFETEFHVDELVGARNQLVWQKKVQKSPNDVQKIFQKYKDKPTRELVREILDMPIP